MLLGLDEWFAADSDVWRALHVAEGSSLWPLSLADIRHVDLRGRHALMSGGNTGIGFHAAKELVKKGCNITLACREVCSRGRSAAALMQRPERAGRTDCG
jgi:hypothetical protein